MKLYVTKEIMKRGWAKELNSLIWEVSDLDGRFDLNADDFVEMIKSRSNAKVVEVVNVDTEKSKVFRFTHRDESDEDIYGWNYVAEDGLKLLLIND